MSNERATPNRPPADHDRLQTDAEQFYEAFSALLRAYQFRDRDRACYQGLSLNGCYALEYVIRSGSTTVKELARELRLNKSSASRIVASLEAEGLIVRSSHPSDLRSWSLEATRAGRDLHRRIRKQLIDRQTTLLARLTPSARAQIVELLDELARSEVSRQCETEG